MSVVMGGKVSIFQIHEKVYFSQGKAMVLLRSSNVRIYHQVLEYMSVYVVRVIVSCRL